jgi:hypothetical protein
MNYRSRRHGDCDSYGPIDRCDPPICWPERPSPTLSNFPGISVFWPMPMVLPMLPSLGGWGGLRSRCEEPYYDRRPVMNRYRCCEPSYRRADRCCDRCGYSECRCERRCDDCGYYECRCERCDRCGCSECRCERCAKCGDRECRCGSYGCSRYVEIVVVPVEGFGHNSAVVDREELCFEEGTYPSVGKFSGQHIDKHLPSALVSTKPDKVTITIHIPAATVPDIYTAIVTDAAKHAAIPKVLGHLTLVVY